MVIGFLGDLVLSDKLQIDDELKKRLLATDFNVANLEAPFLQNHTKSQKPFKRLHHHVNNCDILKQLNIEVVSLANNHIFDYGQEAFDFTLELLNKEGIDFFGVTNQNSNADLFHVVKKEGITIAIGGFVSPYLLKGISSKNRKFLGAAKISNMQQSLMSVEADVKILYNHWNSEFEFYPEPLNKQMAETIIKDCDLLIGSHSHTFQGIYTYKGKTIFNSLGNFSIPHKGYFDGDLGDYPDYSYESFFTLVDFETKGGKIDIKYEIVPYQISKDGVTLSSLDQEKAALFQNKLEKYTNPLQLSDKEYKSFFKSNRNFKSRPVLLKNEFSNRIRLFFYYFLKSIVRKISLFFARMLDFLGIRKFIRRRFAFLIDKIFKI
jgi:poly-gamma-glutamate capsule biosynthesis protein CapA/YwtB (metallophosphatase superfamily)